MPKQYSSEEVIKILIERKFRFISQKGSQAKYRKNNFTVIIPVGRKEIPLGTVRSIMRQAGLQKKDLPRL